MVPEGDPTIGLGPGRSSFGAFTDRRTCWDRPPRRLDFPRGRGGSVMDRLVRARILLAEAAALGVTIDDLIAESSSGALGTPGTGPTVAEYVNTVTASFSKGTAATYKSYWRLLIDRLGERPIGSVDVDDCETVVVDAVERAHRKRPGTDGRSSRESCIGALRAFFARAERADLVTRSPAAQLEKPRRLPNRRRALDDGELRDVIEAVRTTSQDPDLATGSADHSTALQHRVRSLPA